jgi:hypothetical protein
MLILQDRSKSNGIREAFIEDRPSGNSFKASKDLIAKANSASLEAVFKSYNLTITEFNKTHSCPFSFHEDRSPSFNYYKKSNSFYCFGCKNGGGPVEFISLTEGISKPAAARKILSNFDPDLSKIESSANIMERQAITLAFSALCREFLHNTGDFIFLEKITKIYDEITTKYSLDINGMKSLTSKLKIKLNQHICEL